MFLLGRCRPLSFYVRHQNNRNVQFQQEVRLAAWIEQPRGGQAARLARRRQSAKGPGLDGWKKPVKQPDCNQGRRERRPVQTHDEAARGGKRTLQGSSDMPARARTSEEADQCCARSKACARKKTRKSGSCQALQGAGRHAKSFAGAADAGYRDCSCRGAEREAQCLAYKCTLACLPRALMLEFTQQVRHRLSPPK